MTKEQTIDFINWLIENEYLSISGIEVVIDGELDELYDQFVEYLRLTH
jgi:hypothetical protein